MSRYGRACPGHSDHMARSCLDIGGAGTSPAMTAGVYLTSSDDALAPHVHFNRCMMARPITQSLSFSLRKSRCSVNWVMRWR